MSAYFPEDSDGSGLPPNPRQASQRALQSASVDQGLHFPMHRSVLWDRSTLQTHSKVSMHPGSVLPSLLIPSSSIREILSNVSAGKRFEQYALVCPIENIDAIDGKLSSVIMQPIQRASKASYVLYVEDEASFQTKSRVDKGMYFTVPYECAARDPRSSFTRESASDGSSTASLLTNLKKSLKLNSELTLKSLMRIRCTATAGTNPNYLHAALRFEAFLPNASFEFAQLSSLPVQSSSVSSKHLRENAEEIQSGYVTLTQIRRLVLLEEADSLVSTLPIVGVWVHLPFSTQSTRNAGALLLHPIIWGACVRFLHTDKVRDRALVDRTTFLLVVIIGGELLNFEVTPIEQQSAGARNEFAYLDFTVDVAEDEQEPIVCAFKPVTHGERLLALRPFALPSAPTARSDEFVRSYPTASSLSLDELSTRPHHKGPSVLGAQSLSERLAESLSYDTPAPRNSVPVPSQMTSPERGRVPEPPPGGTSNDEASALSVIAVQREEIADLKHQISDLRDMVMHLISAIRPSQAHPPAAAPVAESAIPPQRRSSSPVGEAAIGSSVTVTVSPPADDDDAEASIVEVSGYDEQEESFEMRSSANSSSSLHEAWTQSAPNSLNIRSQPPSPAPVESHVESHGFASELMEPPSAVRIPVPDDTSELQAFVPLTKLANKFPMKRLSFDKKSGFDLNFNAFPASVSKSFDQASTVDTSFTETESIIAIENRYLNAVRKS